MTRSLRRYRLAMLYLLRTYAVEGVESVESFNRHYESWIAATPANLAGLNLCLVLARDVASQLIRDTGLLSEDPRHCLGRWLEIATVATATTDFARRLSPWRAELPTCLFPDTVAQVNVMGEVGKILRADAWTDPTAIAVFADYCEDHGVLQPGALWHLRAHKTHLPGCWVRDGLKGRK